jgi:hypothetical protein
MKEGKPRGGRRKEDEKTCKKIVEKTSFLT